MSRVSRSVFGSGPPSSKSGEAERNRSGATASPFEGGDDGFNKVKILTKGKGLVNPNRQHSLSPQQEAEREFYSRKPTDYSFLKSLDFSRGDGSSIRLSLNDVHQASVAGKVSFDDKGFAIIPVSDFRGNFIENLTLAPDKYQNLRDAARLAREGYQREYYYWFSEGAASGWIAGYDGIGTPTPRPEKPEA